MKIIHILNTGSYSGAENVVVSIISHMSQDIESIYVSLPGTISDVLKENNIRFHPIEKLTVSNLRKVIRDEKPDIIHAHDFTAGIMSALSTNKIPIISHLHNNSPWIKQVNIKSIVYGISCFKYKKIYTVSKSVMNEFIFGKLFIGKTKVIGNPIFCDEIRKKARKAECRDSYDVVFLGRMSEQKNPYMFVDIIKKVYNSMSKTTVAMIGNGDMYEEIGEYIDKIGLTDIIERKGFIKNPYGILENSKLLCMPSSWEGFGLSAIEALAFGKPVVSSNVGGLCDIITNKSGRLCESEDEFVNEIIKLLKDKEYYLSKSEGAFNRSNELENGEEYINAIISCYKSLVRRDIKKGDS